MRYSPEGLPLDNGEPFPALKKLFTHIKKWSEGRDEALPLTTPIIRALLEKANNSHRCSAERCIFDAICLGLQTGSRCSEYCRGNPTNKHDKFSKVPLTHYAGEFAGYPLAFVPSDITFLTETMHYVPIHDAAKKAQLVKVRFRFDKGGTGNVQFRTFKRFSADRRNYCPLLATLRATQRWSTFNHGQLTPLFCYGTEKSCPIYLQDSIVTKHIREATIIAYPNANHLYRTRLKDLRTHSLRVTACLILSVAKLSEATIEHRLRWASTAWKAYVCESLSHISSACASTFFTALEDTLDNTEASVPQAFDADDFL